MKVSFTDAAEVDLETIGDYIALSSQSRAVTFILEVRATCLELRDMPLSFPLLAHRKATGIRRRVHGNYLIFYRVNPDTVDIVRVLHGAMEYEQLLFPDD